MSFRRKYRGGSWAHMHLLHRGVRNSIVNSGGAAGGSAIVHATLASLSEVELTEDSTWQNVPSAQLDCSELTVGNDYLLIAKWLYRSINTSNNAHRCRLTYNSTELTGSVSRHENMGGLSGDGRNLSFVGTFTHVEGGNVQLQNNSTIASFVSGVEMVAIDITQITESTQTSVDNTGVTLTNGSQVYSSAATVDIGDGSSNYLVFACGRVDGVAAGSNCQLIIDVAGTDRVLSDIEAEDSNDEFVNAVATVVEAPAADTTITVEALSETAGALFTNAFVCAINLDTAFADYLHHYTAASGNLGAADPVTVADLNFSSIEAGDYGALGFTRGEYTSSGFGAGYEVAVDVDGGGYSAISGVRTSNRIEPTNPNDEQNPELRLPTADHTAEAGEDTTFRFRMDTAADGTGQRNAFTSFVAFKWETP